MVSRDDTAAMHRQIAAWLKEEAEKLAGEAMQRKASPLKRSRAVRALLHSLGVLAVLFRYTTFNASGSRIYGYTRQFTA